MMGEFDAFAYIHQVRKHPENYVRIGKGMDNLIKQMAATAPLRAAKNMRELRDTFLEATRAAKGDDDLLEYLTEVKDRRKRELTSNV